MVEFRYSTVIWIGLIVRVVLYCKWCRSRQVKAIGLIPGLAGIPLLGILPFIPRGKNEMFEYFMTTLPKRYGGVFKIWVWSGSAVLISSPSAIETMLTSQKLIEKSEVYGLLLPWLGDGLLLASGQKWRKNRRLLTPAFHFQILGHFFDVFHRNAEILCDQLSKGPFDKEIDVLPYMKRCTLDVICEAAMGVKINAQTEDSDYLKAVHKVSESLNDHFFSVWRLFPEFIYRHFHPRGRNYYKHLQVLKQFTSQVIRDRKEELRKEKDAAQYQYYDSPIRQTKKRRAFLDLLLIEAEKGADLTDEDILNEVATFMFEGHDTTAAALIWFLYCMGTHSAQQDLVQKELDDIFGDSDRLCTMEDATNLKYLECCIKESFRLFPSVPYIERQSAEDFDLGGYTIPAGVSVSLQIYALHRNEESFPDPFKFKPERFLPDEADGRHPFAFVPFSAGPRNCIGQRFALYEEKVILSTLLRRFSFRYDIEKHGPAKPYAELVLKPEQGMPLSISHRIFNPAK